MAYKKRLYFLQLLSLESDSFEKHVETVYYLDNLIGFSGIELETRSETHTFQPFKSSAQHRENLSFTK